MLKRWINGVALGLTFFILGCERSAEEQARAAYARAYLLWREAEEVKKESFVEAKRYANRALKSLDGIVEAYPSTALALTIMENELQIGEVSLKDLRHHILPQYRELAKAEKSPLTLAMMLMGEREFEGKEFFSALDLLHSQGKRKEALRCLRWIVSQEPSGEQLCLAMDVAFRWGEVSLATDWAKELVSRKEGAADGVVCLWLGGEKEWAARAFSQLGARERLHVLVSLKEKQGKEAFLRLLRGGENVAVSLESTLQMVRHCKDRGESTRPLMKLALSLLQELKEPSLWVSRLSSCVLLLWEEGCVEEAEELLLQVAQKWGPEETEALHPRALADLALAYTCVDAEVTCHELWQLALGKLRKEPPKKWVVEGVAQLAEVAARRGDYPACLELLGKIPQEVPCELPGKSIPGRDHYSAFTLVDVAEGFFYQGQEAYALHALSEAHRLAREGKMLLTDRQKLLERMAHSYVNKGRWLRALEAIADQHSLYLESKEKQEHLVPQLLRLVERGATEGVKDFLRKARDPDLNGALMRLARLEFEEGKDDACQDSLDLARDILREEGFPEELDWIEMATVLKKCGRHSWISQMRDLRLEAAGTIERAILDELHWAALEKGWELTPQRVKIRDLKREELIPALIYLEVALDKPLDKQWQSDLHDILLQYSLSV